MEAEREKFLRKLGQIEEHARALTQELAPGEAHDRARLIGEVAARLVPPPREELLRTLRQIEEHADALAGMLSPGLPLNRVRQIRALAAHLVLQIELEKAQA